MNDLEKYNKYSLWLFAFLTVLVLVAAFGAWNSFQPPQRWLTLGGLIAATGMLFVVAESVRIGIQNRFGVPETAQHLIGQAFVIAGAGIMLYVMFFWIE